MRGLRGILGVALAAAMTMGVSWAGNEDELSSVKSAMENMKAEMSAMKASMDAERAAMRGNAGGAPEGLLSSNGNATIRIGGDVRILYSTGWAGGYTRGHENTDRVQTAGWAVRKTEVNFNIDLSADTSAYIAIRPDGGGSLKGNILDNAYWQWKNVGGAGFGLTVGLAGVPFGMGGNTDVGGYDWGGTGRAIITGPLFTGDGSGFAAGEFAKRKAPVRGSGDPTDPDSWKYEFNPYDHGIQYNPTSIGVFTSYNWDDQIVLKAGIFASGVKGLGNKVEDNNPGLWNNEIRNLGFTDHVLAIAYNPCYLEGLHLEASYIGRYDHGKGFDVDVDVGTTIRDARYIPNFSLGAVYKFNDALTFAAEGVMGWSPDWTDGFTYGVSAAVDYSFTEKLKFGLGADYLRTSFDGTNNTDRFLDPIHTGNKFVNVYRISAGAKYDFGNGIYVRGEYHHDILTLTNFGDGKTRNADAILLETGYAF